MAGLPQQQQQQPSIWAQMSYTPPRGPCSCKTTLLTTCPCHRFMIHPLKAFSTFDCDGCGHHASFHRMESREEEAVVRRWAAERATLLDEGEREGERERERGRVERERGMIEGAAAGDEEMRMGMLVVAPKKARKRRRIGGVERDVFEILETGEDEEEVAVVGGRKRKGRG